MDVIVVRHGRPEIERRESGIADPGLDEIGRWQAERVSAWLGHEGVDAVITSPKARAIQTVKPLVDHLDLTPSIIADFDEIDRNASVYVPTDLWVTHGQDLLAALAEKKWEELGYDPPDVFRDRVHAAWRQLIADRPGDRVVLACHGGTIREILRAVLADTAPSFHASVEYASITRIRVGDDRSTLTSLNETGHFDADRITMRGAMNTASTMNR